MTSILLVFLGGGLGSVARYGVNVASLKLFGPHFPWGTLAVNVLGGLVMGLIAGFLAFKAEHAWSHGAKLFLMTGVLGGFTTFSAFSLDAMLLYERGQIGLAAAYCAASVLLSVGALALGLALVRGMP